MKLRDFIKRKEHENLRLRERVFCCLKGAIPELISKFPATVSVTVVGSVLKGRFSENSDVDIVIKGLSKEDYFACLNFLVKKINRPVDLILEEDLSEENAKHILKNMEIIYDAKKARY